MATTKSGKFTWGAKSTTKSTKSVAAGYSNVVNCFDQRISSYRTLCAQATGPCKGKRPSPATLNTFSKWIEIRWSKQLTTFE